MANENSLSGKADDADISAQNAAFWNELCGTQLAKSIGVTDDSPASLKKFDDWYFGFYPYLDDHIPFASLRGKDVLEIGLGYGTVAERLAKSGANYSGLDIAAGPVAMVNHRLSQNGLSGRAVQGSVLNAPFASESMDVIVAIGCLHHTGDLARAISECHRILRPRGRLIFMVYYAYSYRRFIKATGPTLKGLFREALGSRGVIGTSDAKDRAAYDADASGQGAPHTDWISKRSLASLCSQFSTVSATVENIDNGAPFRFCRPRLELLKTPIPRWMGLDLYAEVIK